MGRKVTEQEEVLHRLRAVDETPETTGTNNSCTRRSDIVTAVKRIIDFIDDKELKDKETINTYAIRVSQRRVFERLTYEEVGEILGVSHTWIEKQEKPLEPISRYYLEAFSLLYNVSPLYLLGKVTDSGDYGKYTEYPIEPIYEYEPSAVYATHFILRKSFQDSSPLRERLLIDFLKICDAKWNWRNTIGMVLFSSPIINSLIQSKLPPIEADDEIWQDFVDSQTNVHIRLTTGTCFDLLCSLGVRDPKMFDLFLRLVIENGEAAETTCDFLERGGFLTKPRSFRQNVQIDKVAKDGCVRVSVPYPNLIPEDLDDEERLKLARAIEMGRFNPYPQINTQKLNTDTSAQKEKLSTI